MRTVRRLAGFLSTAQERFERTLAGEAFISALVALVVLIGVAWSSPDSAFKRQTLPLVEPIGLMTGLDQNWYMFAPDPYRRLETVDVRITTADGDHRVWNFPQGNLLNQFSWYHWHKLKELSVKDERVRREVAMWAARRLAQPADYPVQVSMVMRTESLPPPGTSEPRVLDRQVLYSATMAAP